MSLRSGRFSYTRDDASTPPYSTHTIIRGKKSDSLFRILNSGDNQFEVLVDGTSMVVLNPAYSIDLAGGSSVEIKAIANGDKVQGMYEYLSPFRDLRSGRFDTQNARKDAAGNPVAKDTALLVSSLTSLGGGDKVYYRFFNSGFNDIGIYATNNHTTGPSAPVDPASQTQFLLRPDQSVDLQIPGNRGAIWVKSQDTNAIEGIYDFIDSEL